MYQRGYQPDRWRGGPVVSAVYLSGIPSDRPNQLGRGTTVHHLIAIEDPRFTLAQSADAVIDSSRPRRSKQPRQRLGHRLSGEPESPEVHGNHPSRAQIEEALQRVFGAGVHGAKVVWTVGPDREQRDLGRQSAPNLGESRKVCRIAGVINRVAD